MLWQDVVIACANLISAIALIPSVFSDNKPATKTSGLTALCLGVTVTCFLTLNLWLSAILLGSMCGLWIVLFFQGLRRDRIVSHIEERDADLLEGIEEREASPAPLAAELWPEEGRSEGLTTARSTQAPGVKTV